MQREQMIEALVIDSLIDILDRYHTYWLHDILEAGFKGYARMSDEELRHEIIRRGICREPEIDRHDETADEPDRDLEQLQQHCIGRRSIPLASGHEAD